MNSKRVLGAILVAAVMLPPMIGALIRIEPYRPSGFGTGESAGGTLGALAYGPGRGGAFPPAEVRLEIIGFSNSGKDLLARLRISFSDQLIELLQEPVTARKLVSDKGKLRPELENEAFILKMDTLEGVGGSTLKSSLRFVFSDLEKEPQGWETPEVRLLLPAMSRSACYPLDWHRFETIPFLTLSSGIELYQPPATVFSLVPTEYSVFKGEDLEEFTVSTPSALHTLTVDVQRSWWTKIHVYWVLVLVTATIVGVSWVAVSNLTRNEALIAGSAIALATLPVRDVLVPNEIGVLTAVDSWIACALAVLFCAILYSVMKGR